MYHPWSVNTNSTPTSNKLTTSNQPSMSGLPVHIEHIHASTKIRPRRTLAEYMRRFGEEPKHGYYELPDLLADLKICPAWKRDDTRTIVDFIKQFWDGIGQFTSNPFICLMRFNHILDASSDTNFVADDIRQYMEVKFLEGLKPEFSYAENILLSLYWSPEYREEIKRDFENSEYGTSTTDVPKLEYVKSWYHKLKHIESREYIIEGLISKMPADFIPWARLKHHKNLPASFSRLCEWMRMYDEGMGR